VDFRYLFKKKSPTFFFVCFQMNKVDERPDIYFVPLDVGGFISSIAPYTHLLSECVLLGKATSHMAPKEDAEGSGDTCVYW
jgi:hypothetical protein